MGQHTPAPPTQLPWQAAGNAGAAETMELLSGMLQVELGKRHPGLPALPGEGPHVPTMMAAIGVIAGYAAQCAAAETVLRAARRTPGDLTRQDFPDGSALYGGTAITRHLVVQPGASHALAGFLEGAVVHAGHAAAETPDAGGILAHAALAAGTPAHDTVRAPPGHAPAWTIGQILQAIWPRARGVLRHDVSPPSPRAPVAVEHWPVVASIVAQQYIGLGRTLMPPPVAAAIVLEAAIKASRRRLIGPNASLLGAQDALLFGPGSHRTHAQTH